MGPVAGETALTFITAPGASRAGRRVLRLILILGFGLTLAACDKCSLPPWPQTYPQGAAPAVPLSCHSDAPAQ